MPYDPKLDECVFSKSWGESDAKINVSVHSYNKGAKKLQLIRENQDSQGNVRFAKLGRLTKDEIEGILPILQEAIATMG